MSEAVRYRARHDAALDRVVEAEKQIAYWQAQQLHAIVDLANAPLPLPSIHEAINKRWVREELACDLKISPDTAGARMNVACNLEEHFPEAVKLLEAGEITMRYLWILTDATADLDSESKRAVLDRVIARAPHQSPTNFKKSVARAVLSVDPRSADERSEDAVAARRVSGRHGDDGVSMLFAQLPTADQIQVLAAVGELATEWAKTEGEQRTRDQLEADALVSLICGEAGDKSRPSIAVNVCVALSTLVGLDDEAGEIVGAGPISATQARLLAQDPSSTWRRLITDDRGVLIDYGRTTYRPPATLADFVRARDRECTFPHCNRAAQACELDHRQAWVDDGHTNELNLHAMCKRNHIGKHTAGWRVELLDDGTSRWMSPIGRTFDKPRPTYPLDTTAREFRHPPPLR